MYGPVQVKITVKNGKLTAVDAVVYPQQDPRDAQINAYAVPALDREALAPAGSRHLRRVSVGLRAATAVRLLPGD
jgi:uncharacterized protein with FMN-binding domain